MKEDALANLIGLGFTDLEARIYISLSSTGPATGYAVAQAINKPTANTYKALSTLQQKGFVLADSGTTKRFAAAPIADVLARIEREFDARRKKTAQALKSLSAPSWDESIYQIKSVAQLYEQFRLMLSRAKQIALLDLGPKPFGTLQPNMRMAARKGVRVVVKAYENATITGVKIVRDSAVSEVGTLGKGNWMSIVIDAREVSAAFLSSNGTKVLQAIWSRSPFLAGIYHHGLMSEITLDELSAALSTVSLNTAAKKILKRYTGREGYAQLAGIRELKRSFS